MNSLDVMQKALQLYAAQEFDCLYCAIADAQTALRNEIEPVTFEEVKQYLTGVIEEMDEDTPLVEARIALKPFLSEIQACPSPMSRERSMDILRELIDAGKQAR